jgi:hypothetical protein
VNGHELIAELQRHPEWLAMQVVLLAEDVANTEAMMLHEVSYDCFNDGEPDVLVLSVAKFSGGAR